VLPALNVVLHDNGYVTEHAHGLVDPIEVEHGTGLDPNRTRRELLEDRIRGRQVVAVSVGIRIVDQADASMGEGVVEAGVLVWPKHPATVQRRDRFLLLGHTTNGAGQVIVLRERLEVDQREA
jgi:hypothetical protein